MEIKLMIDAPELAQALTALAGAIQANTELLLQTYSRPDMMARTSPAAEPAAAEPAAPEPTAPEAPVSVAAAPEAPVSVAAAPEAPASENVVTLAKVRAKMAELGKSGRQSEIKRLLNNYGASKLTDVDPERYTDLWAAMEVL